MRAPFLFVAVSLFGTLISCRDQVESPSVMTPEQFEELSKKSYAYLSQKQEEAQSHFKIGEYERYDWDQEKRQLVWSDGGVPKVIADIQFVGSVAPKAGTWLWSWANSSVLPELYEDMLEVKRYGEAHGIEKLTTDTWDAEEVDGWEMTAIAAYVLQAQGAYRSPKSNGFTFMVFTGLRFAEVSNQGQSGPRD